MTIEQRQSWLDERPGGRHRVLVAVNEARVNGFASSGPYRSRPAYETTVMVMLSVYVDTATTGRGVGTSLYATLIDGLRHADVHRAVAGITLPNPSSIALHRRFGFEEVGWFSEQGWKFGRYCDVAWFERPMP